VKLFNPPALPEGAITEENYLSSGMDVELVNGMSAYNKPFKFFRVNNPAAGAWTYAVLENVPPAGGATEDINVYMAGRQDLTLEFNTDRQYYSLQQNGNVSPAPVHFEAKISEGGEPGISGEHIISEDKPINDALVSIQVTAPGGQISSGVLSLSGDGVYTITLNTMTPGNYDVKVIASDMDAKNNVNNSRYLLTTEKSFYVSPDPLPADITCKSYIHRAFLGLQEVIIENPDAPDSVIKRIGKAIELIAEAIEGIEDDGEHLVKCSGADFYSGIASAIKEISSYSDNPVFGDKIESSILSLTDGAYKLATVSRGEAEKDEACSTADCRELLLNAGAELGSAINEIRSKNYPVVFNHLSEAWKFSRIALGEDMEECSEATPPVLPGSYLLAQNYPNPFNPGTHIDYQLPEKNHVSLQIFDVLGKLVDTIEDGEKEPGFYSIYWNSAGFASGVYMCRMISGNYIAVKKLVLIK
jgi:hypothetical protein